ncbi:UNVERIFIED_CONTAM: FT-interacting protein 3 [Sesamum calycinum]|uniref:FT-interacting protein 3 n=1 Tax=Sesamum calycinum TaxID=2727403 RepID=A0AAW2SAF4_9LAMI
MKSKDGRGTTDAYCVAKYGPKWVRTRTIIDSVSPKWNEQYTWEVFDPCTVITLGVFDNGHLLINGVRRKQRFIRLSTLTVSTRVSSNCAETFRGEKDGRSSVGCELDVLRYQAIQIVSARLGRAEPPLKKEAIEYMLDVGSHIWSVRKAKANFVRIMNVMSGVVAVAKWFDQICQWKNPLTTILIHILFVILILYPELIFPTLFLYLFFIGIWNYRWKARHPPHMDIRLHKRKSLSQSA